MTGKLALGSRCMPAGREEVFPKTIELTKDGVEEVVFDPFEIPEAESVRLTLKGTIGGTSDEITVEVPVRPWGVEAVASESGTGTESTTVFVGLPPGRSYENPEMLIVVSPSLERMLIEMAVGEDAYPGLAKLDAECSAADLLSAAVHDGRSRSRAACGHVGASVSAEYPRGRALRQRLQRLTQRIQGLVAAIVAVSEPRRRLALGQPASRPRAWGRTHRCCRPATAWPRPPSSGRSPRPSRSGC